MITTAYEFLCANEAGLILIGEEDRRPVWAGRNDHFRRFNQLVDWFERTGTLPFSFPRL